MRTLSPYRSSTPIGKMLINVGRFVIIKHLVMKKKKHRHTLDIQE